MWPELRHPGVLRCLADVNAVNAVQVIWTFRSLCTQIFGFTCTLHAQLGIPQPCPREPPPTACAASPRTPWKVSTSQQSAYTGWTAVSQSAGRFRKQLNLPTKFCSAEVHSAWSASCRGRHRLTTALEGFAAKKLSAASRGILPLDARDSEKRSEIMYTWGPPTRRPLETEVGAPEA